MKIHLPHLLRKALLACFSTAVVSTTTTLSSAAITDGLIWAESFDGSGHVEDMDSTFAKNNAFYEENGVGIAGGDHANSRIWTTNMSGAGITDSFTISFTLVDFQAAAWTNLLGMNSNGRQGDPNSIQLTKNSAGELMVYTTNFGGAEQASGDAANFCFGLISDLTGQVLTLTYGGDVLTGYVNGVAIEDTVNFTYADGTTPAKALTGFQIGCNLGGGRISTSVTMDNIAMWNRALTAAEIASYLNPTTSTVVLEQDFSAVSETPEGWTTGQWNGWNAPHFNYSAEKGATVKHNWKQNSLQKAITLNPADGYEVSFTTYSTTTDKGCIFYLSSADYSVVMGQSYNGKEYVSVGYLTSSVITCEENVTVEGARMVTFQDGNNFAVPSLFGDDATSNGSGLNHAGNLTYDIILNGTSLSVTVTDGTAIWSKSFTIQEGVVFDKIGFILDGSTDSVGIKNVSISTKTAEVEDVYITSGAVNWAGGTTGNWTGSSWTSNSITTPSELGSVWKDSATFSGTEASTVTVDTAAAVKNLTVTGTSFTFQKNDAGSLSVDNKITVGENGTLVLNMPVSTKDVELTAASSTLTVNTLPTISGKVTATAGGTIDASGLGEDEYLMLNNAKLGGGVAIKGVVVLNNATLTGSINNSEAALYLSGTTKLDIEAIDRSMAEDDFTLDTITYHHVGGEESTTRNGYTSTSYRTSKLFTNTAIPGMDTLEWTLADGTTATVSPGASEGELIINSGISTEYVAGDSNVALKYNASDVEFDRATALILGGGDIVLESNLALKNNPLSRAASGVIRAQQDGSVTVGNGVVLSQDSLVAGENVITVKGGSNATFDLGSGTSIKEGVAGITDKDWTGTVQTSAAAVSDLTGLGNASSAVRLTSDVITPTLNTGKVGQVSVDKSLTADSINAEGTSLTVAGATHLKSGASTVENADFQGGLTLGDGQNAATLTATGALTLGELTVTSAGSYVTAGSLTNDVINIVVTDQNQKLLNSASLLQLTNDDTLPTITLNGSEIVDTVDDGARYFTSISWENNQMVLNIQPNENYVKQNVEAESENAKAGAAMLDAAFVATNPTTGTMSDMLDAVATGAVDENALAAVAGASTAVLGMATIGDVDRQLQSIRNRTTTMGVNQEVVNDDMPYYNAWINAEGGRGELKQSGTASGYEITSWGGTVGFDVDICPTFTAGMALTAMYGDVDAYSSDAATGDIDTYYVTAFARYCASAWTHTFVATMGLADISLDRTVWGDKVKGETDGMSFGLMYEVGRVFSLNEDGTACIQPMFNVAWRRSTVDSYTEKGSDMALEVGEQELNVVTFGAGARIQAEVGQSVYNRTSIFECRALVKVDAGDRSSAADVALAAAKDASQKVESNELGALGLELGGGLVIPVGPENVNIFIDASIELRGDYQNINAALGYRMNF